MARIHGRRGALYAAVASGGTAEPIAFLNNWTLDSSTDKADVTAFGDTNKVYVSGLPDASGSFSGWYDTDTQQLYTASQDGLARKMYLYPDRTDSGEYFFGTALFDFSVTTGIDGGVGVSGNWSAASAIAKVSS